MHISSWSRTVLCAYKSVVSHVSLSTACSVGQGHHTLYHYFLCMTAIVAQVLYNRTTQGLQTCGATVPRGVVSTKCCHLLIKLVHISIVPVCRDVVCCDVICRDVVCNNYLPQDLTSRPFSSCPKLSIETVSRFIF